MTVYEPPNEWVRAQNAAWRDLAGSVITGWSGRDVDITWDGGGVFLDASAPFQQLCSLRVEREGAAALDFGTYQNDQSFGLSLAQSGSEPLFGYEGSRESDLRELPVGRVDKLQVHLDARDGAERDLIEVLLTWKVVRC